MVCRHFEPQLDGAGCQDEIRKRNRLGFPAESADSLVFQPAHAAGDLGEVGILHLCCRLDIAIGNRVDQPCSEEGSRVALGPGDEELANLTLRGHGIGIGGELCQHHSVASLTPPEVAATKPDESLPPLLVSLVGSEAVQHDAARRPEAGVGIHQFGRVDLAPFRLAGGRLDGGLFFGSGFRRLFDAEQ